MCVCVSLSLSLYVLCGGGNEFGMVVILRLIELALFTSVDLQFQAAGPRQLLSAHKLLAMTSDTTFRLRSLYRNN